MEGLGTVLPPTEHGTIWIHFECYTEEQGMGDRVWWVEARGAAKYPVMCGTALHPPKNDPINSVKFDKP